MQEHLLGQLHQVVVVGVGLVELEHRELGIVLGGDALVPEVSIDLVHPVQAAHHQALEVQLGRDAQVERHVERVVVRHERLGRGAPRDRLHHRGLHFEEAPRVEERAQGRDEAALHDEGLADLGIDDQVDIASAVTSFHVLQAVPLFGQGTEGLGEELELLHRHRQLGGARAEQLAGDPDEVAHVEIHEGRVRGAEHVGAGVDLDLAGLVPQHREAALAVVAHRHHPPGQRDRPRALQHRLVGVLEPCLQRAAPVGDREARPEGAHAARPPGVELLAAAAHLLVGVGGQAGGRGHGTDGQGWGAGRAAVR